MMTMMTTTMMTMMNSKMWKKDEDSWYTRYCLINLHQLFLNFPYHIVFLNFLCNLHHFVFVQVLIFLVCQNEWIPSVKLFDLS